MRTDVEILTQFRPFKLGYHSKELNTGRDLYARLAPGCLVWWRDGNEEYFGRVYGLVRTLTRPRKRTGEACVLVMNNGLVYERWVKFSQIVQVLVPTNDQLQRFRWLFTEASVFTSTPHEMARQAMDFSGQELMESMEPMKALSHELKSNATVVHQRPEFARTITLKHRESEEQP